MGVPGVVIAQQNQKPNNCLIYKQFRCFTLLSIKGLDFQVAKNQTAEW